MVSSRTRVLLGLAVLAVTAFHGGPAVAAKVACVGDSITYGYGLSNPSQQSYPAVLQTLLGSAHTVRNFGTSGCTMLKKGDQSYWNDANFTASDTFKPDVVVIMLGTNDAKPQNWTYKADFPVDYASMIDHYRTRGALVYVAAPPPVYPPGGYSIPPTVVSGEVVPAVRQVATTANAPLIDVFTALSNKASDFPDYVHPNAAGAQLIAQTVATALQQNGFGGTGGASGSGGASTATGGSSGGGGSAKGSGGASGSGGAAGTGGSSGASGGAPGSGGSARGSGGVAAGGGTPGSGGASGGAGGSSTGGGSGSGGAVGTGGARTGTGGLSGSGGIVDSGGTMSGGGGVGSGGQSTNATAAGTGGAGSGGSGGSTAQPGGNAGGCGCRLAGGHGAAAGPWLLLFLLFAIRTRRVR